VISKGTSIVLEEKREKKDKSGHINKTQIGYYNHTKNGYNET
jgi:hypothetical protein